jgi:transposase
MATQPVDFRKGAEGLALLAKETLGHDPMKGVAVVFRAKRADRVKIVVWDGSGLVLYWKRLEGSAFKWPPVVDGVMRMNAAQLSALLDEGAENWALLASLIETCKRNGVSAEYWLTDVLAKLVNGWPAARLDELLPWASTYTMHAYDPRLAA